MPRPTNKPLATTCNKPTKQSLPPEQTSPSVLGDPPVIVASQATPESDTEPSVKPLQYDVPDMADVLKAFSQIKAIRPECAVLPLINKEDLNLLASSVQKIGIKHAIQINDEGELLDGRGRLAVAFLLGIEPPIEKIDEDPVDIAWLNLARRHLTVGQKSVTASDLLVIESDRAAKRKLANLEKGNEIPECDNCRTQETETGRASDIAGRKLGVSGKSVERAAKLSPKLKKQVRNGELTLNAACQADKKRTQATVGSNSKTISPTKSTNPKAVETIEVRHEGGKFTVLGAENCSLEVVVYGPTNGEWRFMNDDDFKLYKAATRDLAIKHSKSMIADFLKLALKS